MNYGMIRYIIGRILMVEAVLLGLPFFVGLIYRENWINLLSFLATIAILVIVSLPLGWKPR